MTGGGIARGLNHAMNPSVMTGGGIAGGLNHAINPSVMTGGGIAGDLNHAIKTIRRQARTNAGNVATPIAVDVILSSNARSAVP
jgi:hypothetical protein